MRLIIDIDEDYYEYCRTYCESIAECAIAEGTPLETRPIEDNATLTVDDFEDDTDFMENISKVSTEELFNSLEYYGCDGYYAEIYRCVLEELKKRVR